jgi:dual specificity protein kinase YAK1
MASTTVMEIISYEFQMTSSHQKIKSKPLLIIFSYTILTRYQILYLLGKGTFGQVVRCICDQTKEEVAIKVIKNKKAFKNQGVVEIKILDILNRLYDPNEESPLVRMLDFFVYREHLCIVFELLSLSVYDLLKKNDHNGISLNFGRLII